MRLPQDKLDADRFYRTLEAYAIAARNGAKDPWAKIGWHVDERHAEIIMKLVVNDPEHQAEVDGYLRECLRLAIDAGSLPQANIIQFPINLRR